MARVTVEDCLRNLTNRFDLVIEAAARAHKLELGAVDPLVARDNDKPTVIALREIAAGFDVADVELVPDMEIEEAFITVKPEEDKAEDCSSE